MNESGESRCNGGWRVNGGDVAYEREQVFERVCVAGRNTIGRLRHSVRRTAFFQKLHVDDLALPGVSGVAPELLRRHPIDMEQGFEGNPGIEGGFWPSVARKGDALAFLRFANGTVDLPVHVHEFSDRFVLVDEGTGLFHYIPGGENYGELRSLVVQAGDIVVFTRGLVHTFTAPVADLVLLSYHAPYFEFADPRQFSVPTAFAGTRASLLEGLIQATSTSKALASNA